MLRSSYSPNLHHELKMMERSSPRTSVVGSGILLGQNAFEENRRGPSVDTFLRKIPKIFVRLPFGFWSTLGILGKPAKTHICLGRILSSCKVV